MIVLLIKQDHSSHSKPELLFVATAEKKKGVKCRDIEISRFIPVTVANKYFVFITPYLNTLFNDPTRHFLYNNKKVALILFKTRDYLQVLASLN